MKSGMGKIVGMIVWIMCSLAGIHLGLMVMGYNVFAAPMFNNGLAGLVMPLHYLAGVCGLISLYLFICSCRGGGCKC